MSRLVSAASTSGADATHRRPLRIVYLDHVARLSGGELALLRLLRAQTGVEAHVILAEDGPLADRLRESGISVEVLPIPRRTGELRKDRLRFGRVPIVAAIDTLGYALRVARRLRSLRPDLVHTNSLKSGVYGSVAARVTGTPLVWHLRDRLDEDYLPRPAILLVRGLISRLATVVICNSRSTQRTLGPRTRSVVIASIPALTDSPARADRPHVGPFVAGMIGRLAPWKGQHVFLRAFAKAFADGDQRAAIVGEPMFGDTEIEYAAQLRRLAEELGIADRVEFRGHREEIADELARIDVLVHASTTPEPFGQTVVEGMSAGLPVVAVGDGGPGEIISDGVDGLLYRSGDVSELARILARLENQPELRRELAGAAVERAREFSPSVISEQVLRVYQMTGNRVP